MSADVEEVLFLIKNDNLKNSGCKSLNIYRRLCVVITLCLWLVAQVEVVEGVAGEEDHHDDQEEQGEENAEAEGQHDEHDEDGETSV